MDDIADRTLFVNKILRRYEEDVPPIKQRLWDGEDRLLLAEIASLRSDNARLAKELEEARKAPEPAAWGVRSPNGGLMWLTDLKAQSERWAREGHHIIALVPAQSAAIRHKATVTTDDLPEGGSET